MTAPSRSASHDVVSGGRVGGKTGADWLEVWLEDGTDVDEPTGDVDDGAGVGVALVHAATNRLRTDTSNQRDIDAPIRRPLVVLQ